MRRNIRVWDSVRHAQAIGLARRIQSAAKLRPRHRAKSESEETINHLSGSSIWRPPGGGLGGLLGRLESQDGSKLGPKREVLEVLKRS